MTISEFKTALNNGVVKFSFTKKDGTVREAVGTTKLDYIGSIDQNALPKGTENQSKKPLDIIRYYDLDKQGWRSFRENQFIEVGVL